MENKKTTELMSRKSTLKSKLMAAVSMLLVSAIMVSVTTYAWFILSTAPEVKGMSTTVGSNGALEMALVDYAKDEGDLEAILGKITTNVGDSSAAANKKVEDSNRTWGNLVDLSGGYYGLSDGKMVLYPSALNLNGSDKTKIGSMDAMLKYAAYGTDGRVAELKGDTFATKYDSDQLNFLGYNGYGVRAIGTGTKADPVASGFAGAKTNYANAVDAVKTNALASLNSYGKDLANMAVKHGMDDNASYTEADVTIIMNAKAGLVNAADQIKVAIQQAYNAYYFSQKKTAAPDLEIATIKAAVKNVAELSSVKDLIDKYEALVNTLNTITKPTASNGDGIYSWSGIQPAIDKMINSDTLMVNNQSIGGTGPDDQNSIKNAAKAVFRPADGQKATEEQKAIVSGLLKNPKLTIAGGAYCDVADFVGEYTSKAFDLVIIEDVFSATGATMQVKMNSAVTQMHFTDVTAAVNGLTAPAGAGSAENILSTAYGYTVDLAFRSNAAGNLKLTKAVERVDGATGLPGGGATFTVTDGTDVAKLAKALRVVFINTADNTILGVAGIDTADMTNGNTYGLHMYNYTVDDVGTVTLGEKKADDSITTLTKDTAKAISTLVYVDGGAVDYAMDKVTGSLNLQFCTDAKLQPMKYDNYATAGLTFTGETTNATVSQAQTIARPTTIKVGNTALTDAEMDKVTWKSSKTDVATVNETTGVVTVGSTAGETVITATYTDNSGTHTGSYTLKVS